MPTHVSRDERSTSFKSCFNDELDDNDDDSAVAMHVAFEAHEEEEEVDSARSGIIDIAPTTVEITVTTSKYHGQTVMYLPTIDYRFLERGERDRCGGKGS